MSRDDLTEAMRLGSRSPAEKRKVDDLGRFGLGMKTASISQCRRMTVVSRQKKIISACEWKSDAIARSETSEWNALVLGEDTISEDQILTEIISKHFSAEKSGTIVVWRNLDASFASRRESTGEHHFSAQMDSARKHLELVFHRFLAPPPQLPKIAIDFNETPLEAFDPFGPSIPARQELPLERITVQGQTISIQPYVFSAPVEGTIYL